MLCGVYISWEKNKRKFRACTNCKHMYACDRQRTAQYGATELEKNLLLAIAIVVMKLNDFA